MAHSTSVVSVHQLSWQAPLSILTKLKEIDALGASPQRAVSEPAPKDAGGPSSTSPKICRRFQKHLAVALNNMRREKDDPSDDGCAPFYLC